MKKYLSVLIIAVLAVFASCSNGDDGKTVYTVTFETDGGTPVPSVQRVEEGSTATAPSINPTKAGYAFVFWHVSGATTAYNFQSPVNRDITLYAKWQEEATAEYWQVTWNLNGGTWPSDDNHATQVLKGGTLVEPNAPAKSGCTFEGWHKESGLANKVTFPYDVSSVTADFTLYAKWETGKEPEDTEAPHKTDNDLSLAGYYLAYTIDIIEQYKKGLRPTYIENEEGETILKVNYTPNKSLDYIHFYRYVYNVIFSYNRPMLLFRSSNDMDRGWQALSAINNNTYDFDNDPGIVMAYFGVKTDSSVFISLSKLKELANNNGITEEVYKKIAFPDDSYKLIIYVRKNEKTFGKYVGYSDYKGETFRYWCIDSNDSYFGRSFTMKIPFDI